MQKGYLTSSFSKNYEFKLMTSAQLATEKRNGWIDVSAEHENSFGLGNQGSTNLIVVARTDFKGSTRKSGMLGSLGLHSRGTNVATAMEALGLSHTDVGERKATLIKAMSEAAFAQQVEGRPVTLKLDQLPQPITNGRGTVTDYRYEMSEVKQVSMLGKETKLTTNLGNSYASIHAKAGSKHINFDVLNMLNKDFKESYLSTPSDFIWINGNDRSPTGELNEYQDDFNRLPEGVRNNAYRLWGDRGIPVRRGSVNLIFGQDSFNMSELGLLEYVQKMFPNIPVQRWVDIVEHIIKNIVQISKADIVIRTLDVVFFNLLSNVVTLRLQGVPFTQIPVLMIEGYKYLINHLRTDKEIISLQIQLAGTTNKATAKQLAAKIANLESIQRSNPAAQLIDNNMYPIIAEDVDLNSKGFLDSLKEQADTKANQTKGGNVARQITNLAFMTKDSLPFKFLAKTTQMTDFAARYAQMKYETKLNAKRKPENRKTVDEIVNEVMDSYVYYDVPDSKFLEYMNDIGLVMFTKFFMRIQRVLLRLVIQKSANAASLAVQQALMFQIEDIFEQSLFLKQYEYLFYNPLDHIQNLLTPEGLAYLLQLLGLS
jgi:hypothetical protein